MIVEGYTELVDATKQNICMAIQETEQISIYPERSTVNSTENGDPGPWHQVL